jgi:hypothetical protein
MFFLVNENYINYNFTVGVLKKAQTIAYDDEK